VKGKEFEKYKFFPTQAMKAYRESRGIAPLILNLVIRQRRVVSFIAWLNYY
jgi:hypothetical protein